LKPKLATEKDFHIFTQMKLFYLLAGLMAAFPTQSTNVQGVIKSIENALPEVVRGRPRSNSIYSFEEAIEPASAKISSEIAANGEKLKSGLLTLAAEGRAHGKGSSRIYPPWSVTPSQNTILDMRQHGGWDVSKPEVIQNIRNEANALDARTSNARSREHNLGPNFIKGEAWTPPTPPEPEKVPASFLAKGTAHGFDEARVYPSWINTPTQKRFLDKKQAEGLDVSLPAVIDDIIHRANSHDMRVNYRKTRNPMRVSRSFGQSQSPGEASI
jgi:hypothetical protein